MSGFNLIVVVLFGITAISDSPFVADGWKILQNVQGDGTWNQAGGNDRDVVEYGTCGLATHLEPSETLTAKLGNGDITDIIYESIARYGGNGTNGKVGAYGYMQCEAPVVRTDVGVHWSLYHT
ncbi:hypothetical protein VTK73DRAFT_3883 [Phialemonium thermophilum]|uniref:Ecp2 effector protein-like domain-containing protein n=1 Tax=Phialemonium thermophilum TaxID=223376 RepID=A0ABR3WWI5_9PEZI